MKIKLMQGLATTKMTLPPHTVIEADEADAKRMIERGIAMPATRNAETSFDLRAARVEKRDEAGEG